MGSAAAPCRSCRLPEIEVTTRPTPASARPTLWSAAAMARRRCAVTCSAFLRHGELHRDSQQPPSQLQQHGPCRGGTLSIPMTDVRSLPSACRSARRYEPSSPRAPRSSACLGDRLHGRAGPGPFVTADFDDGDLDLVVANSVDGTIQFCSTMEPEVHLVCCKTSGLSPLAMTTADPTAMGGPIWL